MFAQMLVIVAAWWYNRKVKLLPYKEKGDSFAVFFAARSRRTAVARRFYLGNASVGDISVDFRAPARNGGAYAKTDA